MSDKKQRVQASAEFTRESRKEVFSKRARRDAWVTMLAYLVKQAKANGWNVTLMLKDAEDIAKN